MKTKIIPFDLEMAKKIQAGEIEGNIVEVTTKKFTYNSHKCIAIDQKVDKFIELPEDATKLDDITTREGSHNAFSKHEFKPFDKVLVRDLDTSEWRPRLYSRKGRVGYCTQDCCEYMQILPYKGNEHLVGTTDKPKEI